jgi:hypothetical protein
MSPVTERDWYTWHDDYDDPATALARRLAAVQEQIRLTLDAAPPGPLAAISLCAGQGRDLLGVLYAPRMYHRRGPALRFGGKACGGVVPQGFQPGSNRGGRDAIRAL